MEDWAPPSDTTVGTLAFSYCRALSERVICGLCFKRFTLGPDGEPSGGEGGRRKKEKDQVEVIAKVEVLEQHGHLI